MLFFPVGWSKRGAAGGSKGKVTHDCYRVEGIVMAALKQPLRARNKEVAFTTCERNLNQPEVQ